MQDLAFTIGMYLTGTILFCAGLFANFKRLHRFSPSAVPDLPPFVRVMFMLGGAAAIASAFWQK